MPGAGQCRRRYEPVEARHGSLRHRLEETRWHRDLRPALCRKGRHQAADVMVAPPSGCGRRLVRLQSREIPSSPGNTHADRTVLSFCLHRIEDLAHPPDLTRRNGMARRSPPRKVTYFEPVPPRLARNTIIESTFEVGRRFRYTMRVDCGGLTPQSGCGRVCELIQALRPG